MRQTLTLKKRPDPSTQPKVDPAKVGVSEQLGWRFVNRDHRYILQRLIVSYDTRVGETFDIYDLTKRALNPPELSRTWIDVPLVPEAYCG